MSQTSSTEKAVRGDGVVVRFADDMAYSVPQVALTFFNLSALLAFLALEDELPRDRPLATSVVDKYLEDSRRFLDQAITVQRLHLNSPLEVVLAASSGVGVGLWVIRNFMATVEQFNELRVARARSRYEAATFDLARESLTSRLPSEALTPEVVLLVQGAAASLSAIESARPVE